MKNAEKFQEIFQKFATEVWAFPEKDFLTWLNAEYEEPTIRNCFGCKYSKDNHNSGTEECHLCMWENQYTPKQEPIIDKIRAEIEPTRKMYLEMNDIDWLNGCDYVLSVIDKYKAENEET